MTNLPAHADQPQNEISRIVAIDEIGKAGLDIKIDAGDDERAALARRFGLVTIDDMTARVKVRRLENGGVWVRGRLAASLVQNCVVTLEPVASHVREEIDVRFTPDDSDENQDVLVVAFGDEAPEPLDGDVIDVGEVVAEHFALAIDNYPRRPRATFTGFREIVQPSEDETAGSPFATLRNFKPMP